MSHHYLKSVYWKLCAQYLLLALAAGCADIEQFEDRACGNAVIDVGEDCDRFALGNGTACRSPGEPDQCRYDCSKRADGSRPNCPEGWGCGTDSICRAAKGTFEPSGVPFDSDVVEIGVADFDGDKRQDIVSISPTQTRLRYYLEAANSVQTHTLSRPWLPPALGDLSGDGLADLAFPDTQNGAVGIALGRSDRTLAAQAYPILHLGPGGVPTYFVVPASSKTGEDQALIVLNRGVRGCQSAACVFNLSMAEPLFLLSRAPEELAEEVQLGNFDERAASPCSEFVLAFKDESEVRVYSPCSVDSDQNLDWTLGTGPVIVRIPGDTVKRGVLVADVNVDAHLDLIIGGSEKAYVAYGTGEGTFRSAPETSAPVNNTAGVFLALASNALPLAIADIDNDRSADFVNADNIQLSSLGSSACGCDRPQTSACYCQQQDAAWSSALVADFNHDGQLDVVASVADHNAVDFYSYVAPGLLSYVSVATSGPVTQLSMGDYDGDGIKDVALAERGKHAEDAVSGDLGDSLSILFGRAAGAPEPPASMGLFARIAQLSTRRERALDPKADIAVGSLSEDNTAFNLAVLKGSSDRQLLAPFGLTVSEGENKRRDGLPLRTLFGRFTDDNLPDLAAITDDRLKPRHSTRIGDDEVQLGLGLWLAQGEGSASLRSPSASATQLAWPIDGSNGLPLITAGDLNGDLKEELLIAMQVGAKGNIVIAESRKPAGSDVWQWEWGPPHETGYVPASGERAGQLALIDLDGDGALDILLRAVNPQAVIVFWGHGDGTFDFDSAQVIDVPGSVVNAVAWLNLDSTPTRELALLTNTQIYAVSLRERKIGIPIALTTSQNMPLTGGALLGAGDVSGDGVDDLVVAGVAGVQLFQGMPVLP